MVTNFPQHVKKKQHANEFQVIKINSLHAAEGDSADIIKKKDMERKRLIDILRNQGNHQHNLKVIEQACHSFTYK